MRPSQVAFDWQFAGPPRSVVAGDCLSWLYVPLLLHSCGRLHRKASSAWAADTEIGPLWLQAASLLQRSGRYRASMLQECHRQLRHATHSDCHPSSVESDVAHKLVRMGSEGDADAGPQIGLPEAVVELLLPSNYISPLTQEMLFTLLWQQQCVGDAAACRSYLCGEADCCKQPSFRRGSRCAGMYTRKRHAFFRASKQCC